jgi:large subunit ribosomal protein L9
MKVLLIKDVKKIGWLGDVIEATEGYARNYLFPQGLAVEPTKGNLRAIMKKKAESSASREMERKRLEVVAKAVEGAEVVLSAKANEVGHLFGSISESDIASNLRSQGFEIADDVVDLGAHIKQTGTMKVSLLFDKDLTATIKVIVVAEQEAAQAEKGEDEESANQ